MNTHVSAAILFKAVHRLPTPLTHTVFNTVKLFYSLMKNILFIDILCLIYAPIKQFTQFIVISFTSDLRELVWIRILNMDKYIFKVQISRRSDPAIPLKHGW